MDDLGRAAWERHVEDDVAGVLAGLAEGTLGEAFQRTARQRPDAVAVQVDDDALTHAELDERAAAVAGWLRGRLPAGARVVIAAPNGIALVTAYAGVVRAGCVAVLASPALTERELRHLVSDAGAEAAFAAGASREALARIGHPLRTLAALDGTDFGDVLACGLARDPEPVPSDSPALLAYTSGTTGTPKGVPLSHANLLSSIRAALAAWRWTADDVLVHALPLTHQHGLGGVHAALLTGSRTRVLSRFDPRRLVETVAEERASVLFAVPAMYERVAELAELTQPASLRRLRLAVCGSAPLSPELARRVATAIGQVPLERYGTTESGLNVSNPLGGPRLPGTVGLPLPGVELRICDAAGRDAAEGEIVLRGPQVFTGYWNRPEATADAFHPGGWFRTGDLGHVDPATGHLTISGRSKELVITGGLNVYPREVEQVLEEHPGVAEAAVAGLPSARWGEEVTAWVVPAGHSPAVSGDALIAFARARLAPYKCPKRVLFIDALPRNAMGKIVRHELPTHSARDT
ncbi:class I adenylate-forming enzyme family protein [Nonomuraea turcica]|uniref:class I adenylate-forming enzyme family protein n=1 Tax=Nonomuraea sp. G32 TaxID=3067274 RepID=UPI00273B83A4|nr:AMP-binding protein [Nonomuraea sp. G32]MDP4502297.1 AMP-binding protein [Nonomuraea sp. G32]